MLRTVTSNSQSYQIFGRCPALLRLMTTAKRQQIDSALLFVERPISLATAHTLGMVLFLHSTKQSADKPYRSHSSSLVPPNICTSHSPGAMRLDTRPWTRTHDCILGQIGLVDYIVLQGP